MRNPSRADDSFAESFQNQIRDVHASLREELPGVRRIGVAIYDAETDRLRTFFHSTEGHPPFTLYEVRLADVPSLVELAEGHSDRVLADLATLADSPSSHSRLLLESGYRSSYTRPFFQNERLRGFVFFDSDRTSYFQPRVLRHLAVYAHLVSLIVLEALGPADLMRSAVDVAREMSHLRDQETGAHLDRVARFARLVATEVASREGRDDEFVEFVFLFAPLHDLGKIAIPDNVLLKADRLSEEESRLMRTHVERGLRLVDSMARAFGFDASPHLDILRNIVASHHERFDGSGYPLGLAGRGIPLEARIVAVADVFDALTTERPYKHAWSNEEALAFLQDPASPRFDADCVHALAIARNELAAIQQRFPRGPEPLDSLHEAHFQPV
jgi:HD-GYP domain-containing protein (c-di-GMP phosphodiesterase class II)